MSAMGRQQPRRHLCTNILTVKRAVELENEFHWKEIYQQGFLENMGLEVVGNSSAEIAGAMVEINQRLDGLWDGPEYLVRDVLQECSIGWHSQAKLGSKFVELNKELFI